MMKQPVFKIFAVAAICVVGLSACEELPTKNAALSSRALSDSVRMLLTDMATLRKEIVDLHAEIADLKTCGDLSPKQDAASGEKSIDSLYFDRNGCVSSRIRKMDNAQTTTDYIYDDQGRLSAVCSSPANGASSVATYEYSGKVVTYTYSILYDKDVWPDKEPVVMTTVYEYY